MNTYRVELLVRQMSEGKVVALYVRNYLNLPFVPMIGMRFKQGASNGLWQTGKGELMPEVEAVIYDFDEETLVCLFTINEPLKATFWTKIEGADIERSIYPRYYQTRS